MNVILILCILFAVVSSSPQNPAQAFIIRYDYDLKDAGGFSFNVDTSDGFHHDAQGEIEDPGTQDEGLAVRGSYSYIGPDGVTYLVEYVADKNGFQPTHKRPAPPAQPQPGYPSGGGGGGYSGGCAASLCGTGLG